MRNSLACVEQPTVRPSSITIISLRALPAVLARRVVLPDSLSRLPKKSMPSSGRPEGTMNVVSNNPIIGKSMRSVWLTWRAGFMRMRRSFFVVSRRMSGGWITGTSAMYEYAHTAIAPIRLGHSFDDRNIAVGPSAPPIIAIPAAWLGSKPRARATMYAPKIPNWAAAPMSISLGLLIRAEKSVMAPMPRNTNGGYQPWRTP